MKRCSNCGKPVERTTLYRYHEWTHVDGKPACEGLFATPRIEVHITPKEPEVRIVPVPVEGPMRNRPVW